MKFDTGLFIETVRENPTLYDHQHPDYKDPAKKMKLWSDVAKHCGMPSGEMAKAKWRNVRDSFVKHLKSIKMGSNPKRKYNSWPWSERMEFLIPYVTARHNLSDQLDEDPQSYLKTDLWEDPVEMSMHDDSIRDSQMKQQMDHQRFGEISEGFEHHLHNHQIGASTSSMEQILANPETVMRPFDTTQSAQGSFEGVKIELSDPTDLMMLSHARRIRGFSRKRQLRIETSITQLVMEAEMEEIEEEERNRTDNQQHQST